MTSAAQFCFMLKDRGFDFSIGVPCSILSNVIDCLLNDPDIPYIPATREDEALGIATGAYLAGKKPLVLMQNSGLGNSINALASLDILYRIPILMLISWRGYEGKDAPEHLVMGRSTVNLLEEIGVPVEVVSKEHPEEAISSSVTAMEEKRMPIALILRKGILQ